MQSILQYIADHKQDAIIWQVTRWMDVAKDPFSKGAAVTKVAELLSRIKDMMVMQAYIDAICKEYDFGISKKVLSEALGEKIDRGEPEGFEVYSDKKLPRWIDAKQLYTQGFCEVTEDGHVGYYSLSDTGGWYQSSNFIIKPIFHVSGKAEESRHIFEIWNGVKRALMDVPSRVFIAKDTLMLHLVAEGAFIFFGSTPHLLRISASLLPHFPLCHEIKQLGWQREGFFAYADKIFMPGKKEKKDEEQQPGQLMDISGWGIFEVGDMHFLIPAASQVYANQRLGDDPFKHVRVMSYMPAAVSFNDWAAQMYKVYGNKGLTGIAFALATAFRDLLFTVNHNFPHLYGYGERSSGKSQWAASICAIFYNDRAAYNVNSGTDFAFFSYMQQFINAPANLNEVDDKVMRPEWFQAIKGVFDGEGRMRGKMGSRTQIEVQQADAGLILIGQYLSTQDDNSIVSRSCVEGFAERQYTDEEKAEFMKLTEWQKAGLTSLLTDVLQQRPIIEAKYYTAYNDIVNVWRRSTHTEFNQRIFQNWGHLSAMYHLFEKVLGLPVAWPTFNDYCYSKALEFSRFIRSSDTLTDFWNTVAFLLDQRLIETGWDFKVQFLNEIRLHDGEGKEHTKKFEAPRKLLLMRLNNVHKLYQQMKNKAGERNPMRIDDLKHYFSSRPYFIGQMKQTRFKRFVSKTTETPGEELPMGGTKPSSIHTTTQPEEIITSAFVFDYELLGCELERSNPAIDGDI